MMIVIRYSVSGSQSRDSMCERFTLPNASELFAFVMQYSTKSEVGPDVPYVSCVVVYVLFLSKASCKRQIT